MRYIIIPLLISLYLYWSYKSIKDILKVGFTLSAGSNREYTVLYIFFHAIGMFLTLGVLSIQFCIKNW